MQNRGLLAIGSLATKYEYLKIFRDPVNLATQNAANIVLNRANIQSMYLPGIDNPHRGEYSLKQAKQIIGDALYRLSQRGFDFKFVDWAFGDGGQHRVFRTKTHLKYRCSNKHKNKDNDNNKTKDQTNPWAENQVFTTSFGTVEVKYQFQQINKFEKAHPAYKRQSDNHSKLKDPYIFKWSMKLYRMSCKKCTAKLDRDQPVYAQVFIQQPELDDLIEDIYDLVYEFLRGYKIPRRPPHFKRKELSGHLKNLCEACHKGICKKKKSKK